MDEQEELHEKLMMEFARGFDQGRQNGESTGYDEGYHEGADQAFKELTDLVTVTLRAVKVPMRDNVYWHKRWLAMVKRMADNFALYRDDFDRAGFLHKCDAISKHTARFLDLMEKK